MPQFNESYNGPTRKEFDFYQTERSLIEAFVKTYKKRLDTIANAFIISKQTLNILDPAAGDGRWGTTFNNYFKFSYPNLKTTLTGVELQGIKKPHNFTTWFQGDMVNMNLEPKYDLIVSNPPYGPFVFYLEQRMAMAEVFVRISWNLLRPNGHMIMLLNNDFETGVNRMNGLWSTIYPVEKYPCARRPRFYGTSTSGNNYGIFVWIKNEQGQPEGIPRQWVSKLFIHEREAKNDEE